MMVAFIMEFMRSPVLIHPVIPPVKYVQLKLHACIQCHSPYSYICMKKLRCPKLQIMPRKDKDCLEVQGGDEIYKELEELNKEMRNNVRILNY